MFLVTSTIPAKSTAERAVEETRTFDNDTDATECAEYWLRNGRSNVALWKQLGVPSIKSVIEWIPTRKGDDNG